MVRSELLKVKNVVWSDYHVVTNFKKRTPLFKRIAANVMFWLGTTKFAFRHCLLTRADHKKALRILQKGDIVLVGAHRKMSTVFIPGPVTHSLLAMNKKKLIHAIGDGVAEKKFTQLFHEYDTLMIVRPEIPDKKKKDIIYEAIKFAKKQMGKPYDFVFNYEEKDTFFCTQLISDSYDAAGFDLGLFDHHKTHNVIEKQIKRVANAVRPADVVHGNVEVLFLSQYLDQDKKGRITFSKGISKSISELILRK